MSTDETREALTAMVREGKAAGLYADDHGAAGFCTDHSLPTDRPTTVAAAVEAAARAAFEIKFSGEDWFSIPEETRGSWRDALTPVLEAVGYADLLAKAGATVALADYESACRNQARAEAEGAIWLGRAAERLRERDALAAEVERLRGSADAWWGEYDRELKAHEATKAEVERLRAVGPIAWTFGQRARADRAEAREAALRERVAAEIIDVRRTSGVIKGSVGTKRRRRVDAALLDAAVRVRDNTHAEDEYPADWLAACGLRPLPRERYDAVMDSGPTDEDEGADCG